MYKFTVLVRGSVVAENQEELEKSIRETLKNFPKFNLSFSSIECWTDFNGIPKVFNEDGTPYVEVVEEEVVESTPDQVV